MDPLNQNLGRSHLTIFKEPRKKWGEFSKKMREPGGSHEVATYLACDWHNEVIPKMITDALTSADGQLEYIGIVPTIFQEGDDYRHEGLDGPDAELLAAHFDLHFNAVAEFIELAAQHSAFPWANVVLLAGTQAQRRTCLSNMKEEFEIAMDVATMANCPPFITQALYYIHHQNYIAPMVMHFEQRFTQCQASNDLISSYTPDVLHSMGAELGFKCLGESIRSQGATATLTNDVNLQAIVTRSLGDNFPSYDHIDVLGSKAAWTQLKGKHVRPAIPITMYQKGNGVNGQ